MSDKILWGNSCLQEEIISPKCKTSLSILSFIQIGKYNNLRIIKSMIRAYLFKCLKAIHIWHHDIQNNKIWRNSSFKYKLYCLYAIYRYMNIVSFKFEFIRIHFQKEYIILYHQDCFFHKKKRKRIFLEKYNILLNMFQEKEYFDIFYPMIFTPFLFMILYIPPKNRRVMTPAAVDAWKGESSGILRDGGLK